MHVIVWKVGKSLPSKYHDNCKTRRIIFKAMGRAEKQSYYLNLDSYFMNEVNRWWSNVQHEGNVLNVKVRDDGEHIDMFAPYEVIRDVKKTSQV